MTPRHSLALPLLALGFLACDSADTEDAARIVEPEIVFEGTEVQAALAEDPDTVYLESHVGALYLEEEHEVTEYRRVFELIRAASVPLEDFT